MFTVEGEPYAAWPSSGCRSASLVPMLMKAPLIVFEKSLTPCGGPQSQ